MATEQRVDAAARAPLAPGEQLRAAREAAGMSLHQVAQQLKLAPRQVKALEDQDFAQLPGRTFTRGFVRNYARLLNLDANGLVARLPDATQAPELEAPALQATGTAMAELPSAARRGPSFARWLIPLVLVGCVLAAAGYEWYRGGLATNEPAPGPALKSDAAEQRPSTPASSSVALPNPLDTAARSEPTPLSPSSESTAAGASSVAAPPATEPATPPAPVGPAPAAVPSPSAPAPPATTAIPPPTAPAPAAAPAPSAALPAPPAAAATAPATLLLTYRASAWTHIRDRTGQVLISRTVPAGSERQISGQPPFDIVIGNANTVTLVYRGTSIDLARFTSHNVARLRLS